MARNTLNNLAQLFKAANRLDKVEGLAARAVEILENFERRTGHQHPHMQTVRAKLAAIRAKQKPSFLARLLGGRRKS